MFSLPTAWGLSDKDRASTASETQKYPNFFVIEKMWDFYVHEKNIVTIIFMPNKKYKFWWRHKKEYNKNKNI